MIGDGGGKGSKVKSFSQIYLDVICKQNLANLLDLVSLRFRLVDFRRLANINVTQKYIINTTTYPVYNRLQVSVCLDLSLYVVLLLYFWNKS
jgi:hypothetical protein